MTRKILLSLAVLVLVLAYMPAQTPAQEPLVITGKVTDEAG